MPNRYEIGPKSDPDPKWLTVVWMLTAIVWRVWPDLDFVHVIAAY